MSLTSHVNNLINTSTDSQLLSVRLPSSTVNQIDEFAQILDKTRSDVISAFIDGGIEELDKQLAKAETDEISVTPTIRVGSSDNRYFLLNTNYNNSQDDHFKMLENQEASAFYGNWKENITHLKEGDVVFLYQSGHGICAYGKAEKELIKRDHNGNADQWYSKKLSGFVKLQKPLTAKGCKDITKSNFNFRMTMVSLSKEQGDALLGAIKP